MAIEENLFKTTIFCYGCYVHLILIIRRRHYLRHMNEGWGFFLMSNEHFFQKM